MTWHRAGGRIGVKCIERHDGHVDGHLCRRDYQHDGDHLCICGKGWPR